MFLDRFFKPKWQHPDPEIRKQALEALHADDPLLTQLARDDKDPGTRRSALSRINDLSILWQAVCEDTDAGVRDYAQARLQKLMTGAESASPLLQQRLIFLRDTAPAAMIDFLATHGVEPELRLAALEQVNDDRLRGEIAINDPAVKVRAAALEHLQDFVTLERVAKKSRGRDKRVSRIARERVEQQRRERVRQERILFLCNALETLSWDGETGSNAARFARLEEEWRVQDLQQYAGEEQKQRYQTARDRFAEHFRISAARRASRQQLYQAAQGLQNRLRDNLEIDYDNINADLQQIRADWQDLGNADDAEGRRLEREFSQILRDIQNYLLTCERDQQRLQQLQGMLQQADALLHQAGEVPVFAVNNIEQQWRQLPQPELSSQRAHLQTQFATKLDKLRDRLHKQVQMKDTELLEINTLIEQLEGVLEEGELQKAITLREQAEQRLDANIGIPRKQMSRLVGRLQANDVAIARLRGWRRWGTNRARENLIEEAEKLAGYDLEPADIARQVKELRAAWKSFDHTAGVAPKVLWKRFNDACEKTYAPAQAHFQTQAEQRRQNLQQREKLCQRIEQLTDTTDWDAELDWREISRFAVDIQKQWRNSGPVNRGERKAIEQRYRTALDSLQKRLKPQRDEDANRRRQLISRVEQLLENEDIHAAIEEVKKIQAEWQPRVPGSQRQEQVLWKKFRAACDAIFERRKEAREAQDNERQENLAAKNTLIAAIEALCLSSEELLDEQSVLASNRRFKDLQHQWDALGYVPKKAVKSIEKRFISACEQFENSYRRQSQLRARADIDALQARAKLCMQLESMLILTDRDRVLELIGQTKEQWQALPELPAGVQAQVAQRFERVCTALENDDENERAILVAELEKNIEHKQLLCLRMEILTGVESPPEFAQARMEYQVSRLSESMQERNTESDTSQTRTIEHEWYALGCLPEQHNRALEERFERALNARRQLK